MITIYKWCGAPNQLRPVIRILQRGDIDLGGMEGVFNQHRRYDDPGENRNVARVELRPKSLPVPFRIMRWCIRPSPCFYANALGGRDAAPAVLVSFMAADYVTGILVAMVFTASPKTKGGGLSSGECWACTQMPDSGVRLARSAAGRRSGDGLCAHHDYFVLHRQQRTFHYRKYSLHGACPLPSSSPVPWRPCGTRGRADSG